SLGYAPVMVRKDSIWFPLSVTFAVALLVYLYTLSSSIGWHDSAELALTAWLPTINHAPGSPVHNLLNYLPARLFTEPYLATNFMSALAAALSVAVLAALIMALVGDALIAVLCAVLFGVSFQVWASAVTTEIYSLGLMFLAGAMLAGWYWHTDQRRFSWWLMLLSYGLATGAYFANILLWPAFAFLIYKSSEKNAAAPFLALIRFGLFGLAMVVLIASVNFLLAGQMLPFGAVRPQSIAELLTYMSGAQYEPLQARSGGAWRLVEHASIFGKSLLYLPVIFAFAGWIALLRAQATYAWFTAFIFAIYIGYYTVFGSGDYYLMVNPAYFVCMLWAGYGAHWVSQKLPVRNRLLPVYALLLLLVVAQLYTQLEGRRMMAADKSAERFTAETFEFLPQDAVAIVGWRELTPLVYQQTVHGKRPDIRFVLPAMTRRYYAHGSLDDYASFVDRVACDYPVFTMKPAAELNMESEVVAGPVEAVWRRIVPGVSPCE
ncbi:MAG: protein O-mannosyl-transferase family, partial [Gammaproteobacteria bacterium]